MFLQDPRMTQYYWTRVRTWTGLRLLNQVLRRRSGQGQTRVSESFNKHVILASVTGNAFKKSKLLQNIVGLVRMASRRRRNRRRPRRSFPVCRTAAPSRRRARPAPRGTAESVFQITTGMTKDLFSFEFNFCFHISYSFA